MLEKTYQVAGYVKLAKWWEKSRAKAEQYHKKYYADKFSDIRNMQLMDVYIDITGQKKICKRPEMLRLIRDCQFGRINCIATQTKAYLAANSQEFCYLLYYLFSLPQHLEIITEDDNYHIDTTTNEDDQRSALEKMARDYVALDTKAYESWKQSIVNGINLLQQE